MIPNSLLSVLAIPCVFMMYEKFFRTHDLQDGKQRPAFALLLLAFAESLIVTLGISFSGTGSAALLYDQPVYFLLMVLGRFPLYLVMFTLLQDALAAGSETRSSDSRGAGKLLTGRFSAVILLCWIPWVICLFPGLVSYDAKNQILEMIGRRPLSDANPIFQTLYLGLFYHFGLIFHNISIGIALYTMVQTGLMVWLLGAIVREIYVSKAPAWLYQLSLAFFALLPVFPIYSLTITKDVYFGMGLGLFSLVLYHFMKLSIEPQWKSRDRIRVTIFLSIGAILCTLLRNAGIFLTASILTILVIYFLVHRNRPFALSCGVSLTAVVLVYGMVHTVMLPGFRIDPAPEAEFLNLPLQQTGRILSGCELPEEQMEIIDRVFAFEDGAVPYDPNISDSMKRAWRMSGATDEEQQAFWNLYPELMWEHKGTAVSAVFHSCYGYLCPGYTLVSKPVLFHQCAYEYFAEDNAYWINPLTGPAQSLAAQFMKNPIFCFFAAPGFYGVLVLLAAALLLTRKNFPYLVCTFPAIFLLLGCLMGPVNGYLRYAFPLYILTPFLLMLVSQAQKR